MVQAVRMVMHLEVFQLVLLRRPSDAPEVDEDVAERIQREHLAFYDQQRAAKTVVTNGPVLDQPDETLRGLAFFNVGSLERARDIANTDPAVLNGRLEVEVMSWWCPAGTMSQSGTPITV
jgi:uncharacterized protein YciI